MFTTAYRYVVVYNQSFVRYYTCNLKAEGYIIFITLMRIDEKDFFVLAFGLFLVAVFLLKISTAPFRFESLIVVLLFLLTTRSLVDSFKFFPYLMIAILGLLFSTFLSPYGLLIYFIIALIVSKKINLL